MPDDLGRNYFRIACEFQVRIRKINADELEVFRTHAMRPSQYSTLRFDLENQLSSLSIQNEYKILFEKAFQILINMDQRLERVEEQIQALRSTDAINLQNYDWVQGDMSAGGIAYDPPNKIDLGEGDVALVDILLPSLPEYRVVAAAKVVRTEGKELSMEFEAIHADDKEFIHRFVLAREREVLRSRAKDRDKTLG